jgi:hypothetical protein
MPNPNPPCHPTISFLGIRQANGTQYLRFHVDNPGCTTSTGHFYYDVQYSDRSTREDVQSMAWTAADSSESFDYEFASGENKPVANVVVKGDTVVCSCLD